VDQVVMKRTEEEEVSEARFPSVQPVLDVMPVKEGRVRAPGEGTPPVPQHRSAANGRRNAAGAAADVHRLPVAACGQEGAVAGHPPQRFRGKCARQSLGKEDAM